VTTGPRRLAPIFAPILLGTTLLLPALTPIAAASDGAFAPPESAETRRGHAVAERFQLSRRFILTLDVANAFSAQNQAAIARAEAGRKAERARRKAAKQAGQAQRKVAKITNR